MYHRHCVSSKNKTGVHEETWEQKYNFDTVFVWKIHYTWNNEEWVYSVMYAHNQKNAGRNLAHKKKKTNGRCKFSQNFSKTKNFAKFITKIYLYYIIIIIIHNLVKQKCHTEKSKSYSCFGDLEKAFDSVPRDLPL